ncbi:MAG: hypothetical protein HN790_02515 [Methylococcales bacterium]|jgi:hypothetical protein|nr:hypothetical protein [Methylococcales bacterium]
MTKKKSFYRKRQRTSYRWVAGFALLPAFAVAGISYTAYKIISDEPEKIENISEEDNFVLDGEADSSPKLLTYRSKNVSNNAVAKRTDAKNTSQSKASQTPVLAQIDGPTNDEEPEHFFAPDKNLAKAPLRRKQPASQSSAPSTFANTSNTPVTQGNSSRKKSVSSTSGNLAGLNTRRNPSSATPFQRNLASLGSLNANSLIQNPTRLINSGLLDIKQGSTIGSAGGSFTQSNGKTIVNGSLLGNAIINGGEIQGSGSVSGNLVVNGGEFNPGNSPGTFTVEDRFTLSKDGILNIEIAVLPSDTSGFDPLNIIANSLIDVIIAGSFDVQGTVNFIIEDPLLALSDFVLGDFFKVKTIVNGQEVLTDTDGTGFESATFLVTHLSIDPDLEKLQDPSQDDPNNPNPEDLNAVDVNLADNGKLVEVPLPNTLLLMFSSLFFWRFLSKRTKA